MEAFPRRTENRVEGEVVLWGNRRILCLKIFAIADGGSSHYQDVRKAASLCSSYMVPTHPPWKVSCIEGCIFFTLVLFSYLQVLSSLWRLRLRDWFGRSDLLALVTMCKLIYICLTRGENRFINIAGDFQGWILCSLFVFGIFFWQCSEIAGL